MFNACYRRYIKCKNLYCVSPDEKDTSMNVISGKDGEERSSLRLYSGISLEGNRNFKKLCSRNCWLPNDSKLGLYKYAALLTQHDTS